jgi:hypothetical protein
MAHDYILQGSQTAPEFSLTGSGILHRVYLGSPFARRAFGSLKAQIICGIAVLWMPLLVLWLISRFLGSTEAVNFFKDTEVQARFLVALPLLFMQDAWAQRWLPVAIRQFVDRGLIPAEQRSRFEAIVEETVRLKNSLLADVVIAIVVLSAGQWFFRSQQLLHSDTWYAAADGRFRWPGYWYIFVSLPIFQFLMYRWYYRLIIWYRFMWKLARIPLVLNGLHPDRAGGLGFIARTMRGFELLFAAHSALLAGAIANNVLHGGVRLMSFKMEAVGAVVLMVMLAICPLLFFIPHLVAAEARTNREYGIFASEYVRHFRQRWIEGPRAEEMLGTGDIQSLADLTNSFNVVLEMSPLPFTRKGMTELLACILIPLAPLVLTVVPLNQLIDHLAKLIL